MAYRLLSFDSVFLPNRQVVHDLNTGEVPDPLTASIGGSYDWLRSQRDFPANNNIMARGMIIGEEAILSTGPGLILVDVRGYALQHQDGRLLGNSSDEIVIDQDGNEFSLGDSINQLRAKADALRNMLGRYGRLVRVSDDDPATEQWTNARCTNVDMPNGMEQIHSLSLDVTLEFSIANASWNGRRNSENKLWPGREMNIETGRQISGRTTIISVHNGGNTVAENVTVTIRPQSNMSKMRLFSDIHEIVWETDEPIGSDDILFINGFERVVTLNGINAYDRFRLGDGHTASGWLPLEAATTTFGFIADGNGEVNIEWYDNWI